jgi:hypothetical protein
MDSDRIIVSSVTSQLEDYISLLNLEWFEKLQKSFALERKPEHDYIEYTSDGWEYDDSGKLQKVAPTIKQKTFKEYCWDSFYPGRNLRRESRSAITLDWVDGATVFQDYIPSTIIGFFGEIKDYRNEVEEIKGIYQYRDLYRFLIKLIVLVKKQVEVLKATDTSSDAQYSLILDYCLANFYRKLYDDYGRIIMGYAFIEDNEQIILELTSKDMLITTNLENDIPEIVKKHFDCFRGEIDGWRIMSEENYKVVIASATTLIKKKTVPSITRKIPNTHLLNEFIAKTYHLLFESLNKTPEAPLWAQLIFDLFEQFQGASPESIKTNWQRFRTGKYSEYKSRITMSS